MAIDLAQEEVVSSSGKNLIVSASAGSGKTTVMIRKIIKCIIEGTPLKKILVLTYTKSASEEMKQKLLQSLYAEVSNKPELISQIDDLPTANISTLHSFFQKVIKKYFYVLNISPDFKLCDEMSAETLKQKALKLAMKEYYKTSPKEYLDLLKVYGDDRTDKKLQSVVKALNEFSLSLSNERDWFEQKAFMLYDNKPLLLENLNKDLLFKKEGFVSDLKKILAHTNENKYIAYINGMLSTLESISPKFSFMENYNNFLEISFKRLNKEDQNITYLLISAVKKNIAKNKEELKELKLNEEILEKSIESSRQLAVAVVKVFQKYREIYTKLKTNKNFFDFSDLETNMLKLIANSEVCEELKSQFDYIFVDEYQDANLLQEKIISEIARKNNRFMVGDVKQSIYTFRQANPDIFLGIQEKYSSDKNSENKRLNSNFRSRYEILDFVNYVFNVIMTKTTAGIDYKGTSQFVPKAEYEKIDNFLPDVCIDIVKRTEKENLSPPKLYSVKTLGNKSVSKAEQEAKVVAHRISEMIGKEFYDKALSCRRKIEYKDITILLASRGEYLDEFCSTLNSYGIPVFANSRKLLYLDNQIKVLINLLKLTISENDDIALASSLKSFGKFTLNELDEIAESEGKNFYEKTKNFKKDAKITEKLQKFNNLLQNFKLDMINYGIFTALYKVLDKTNFIFNLETHEEKLRVKKFLNDFLTNGYNDDVVGFIDFVDLNLVLAPSYSAGDNSVTITTIHSSKGLEYPIVFLVNAGADFTKSKKDANIALNEKLGMALKDMPEDLPSLVFKVISQNQKENGYAEKLRLLYVALTRAKNHLIICGSSECDFKTIYNDFDVIRMKSYLDLVMGCFSEEELETLKSEKFLKHDSVEINVIEDTDFSNKISYEKAVNIDENLIPIFKDYFDYAYPYENDTKIALKNSVSRIVKELSTYSQNLVPVRFETKEHLSVDASIIGTKYHEVMEKVDFNKPEMPTLPEDFNEDDADKIQKAITNISNLLKQTKSQSVFKEKFFMLNIPQKQIVPKGSDEKILIQGIIDLLSFGEKNIIVDYKLSSIKNAETLKSIYKTQLTLYKMAVEKSFNVKIDGVYLYNFNTQKIIEIK